MNLGDSLMSSPKYPSTSTAESSNVSKDENDLVHKLKQITELFSNFKQNHCELHNNSIKKNINIDKNFDKNNIKDIKIIDK